MGKICRSDPENPIYSESDGLLGQSFVDRVGGAG